MVVVATDIGGTFTDIVGLDDAGGLTVGKVLSTPSNYADGLITGVSALIAERRWLPAHVALVLHGCTVATNAVLERKGARTLLVTTHGFGDILELRRIRVPRLYQPVYRRPAPLVPRSMRLEVRERIAADGSVVTPLDPADLESLVARIAALVPQAIAVCLINAHANPVHERLVGDRLRAAFPNLFLSLSNEVLPEIREYERTSTTVVNAYIGPPVDRYITTVEKRLAASAIAGPLVLMQSSGGMVESRRVRRLPATLLECGPAAGVIGAAKVGTAAGYPDLLTFDMGGTTAKAALVQRGTVSFTDVFEVGAEISSSTILAGGGGYAVKLPAIDMAEVGAGGGSLVAVDAGGAIRVGPESAGASPGPACYGFGNDQPTVTDANVALGYVDPDWIGARSVRLDRSLAIEAIRRNVADPLGLSVEQAALGIRRVANAAMVRALKTVSVYRGHDTRRFTLFAFGGNGGLHGPEIAGELGIRQVIVPPAAGVFSAVGLLLADRQSTRTITRAMPLAEWNTDRSEAIFGDLARLVAEDLNTGMRDLVFEEQVLCRYAGQAFELPVGMPGNWRSAQSSIEDLQRLFGAAHRLRYGYCPAMQTPIEVVSFRVTGRTPKDPINRMKYLSAPEPTISRRACYFGQQNGVVQTEVMNTRACLREKAKTGPLIISEPDGTTFVPFGARVALDAWDNVIISLQANAGDTDA